MRTTCSTSLMSPKPIRPECAAAQAAPVAQVIGAGLTGRAHGAAFVHRIACMADSVRMGVVGAGSISVRGILPDLSQPDLAGRATVPAAGGPAPGRGGAPGGEGRGGAGGP